MRHFSPSHIIWYSEPTTINVAAAAVSFPHHHS
jgi:hypothetical protein